MERTIFHCDCNNFFASVELLTRPELRGKPVAVSGSVDARHGIILAKNEAAKAYQVKTAETVWSARQKCPNLILLPPHRAEYVKYSKMINSIYAKYTDRIESFGIDESWMDVSGSWQLFADSPQELADMLRREIKNTTGLTISVGVSYNKIFAKIGSDMKKPDATTVISKETYKQILWPLPVSAMLFIGSKAHDVLAGLGITTIGQLAQAEERVLKQLLGKTGVQLAAYARGEDTSLVAQVGAVEMVKSVGRSNTYKRDLVGYKDLRLAIGALSDDVATRLRQKKLYAGGIQLTIKAPTLKVITRQITLPATTNLGAEITKYALDILENNWKYSQPVRMLGVAATHMSDLPSAMQTSVFDCEYSSSPEREKLEQSIDKIRNKYGKNSIIAGGALHNTIGIVTDFSDEVEEE